MSIEVVASGDLACFTSNLRLDRFSYPVMPPTAAVGLLASLHWKPEMEWEIESISVLKPIQYVSIKRNEIKVKARPDLKSDVIFGVDVESVRTQRMTVALFDVSYLVRARAVPGRPGYEPFSQVKHEEVLNRRLKRGAAFRQPYFGLREFFAKVASPTGQEKSLPISMEVGYLPSYFDGESFQFRKYLLKDGVLQAV